MVYRRGMIDEAEEVEDVIDVTGVRVCKVRENFDVRDFASLYSSITSLEAKDCVMETVAWIWRPIPL